MGDPSGRGFFKVKVGFLGFRRPHFFVSPRRHFFVNRFPGFCLFYWGTGRFAGSRRFDGGIAAGRRFRVNHRRRR
jgi:hypothetical protein